MMMTGRAIAFSLALAALSAPAQAEPSDPDKRAAQSLFDQARRLMKEQRHAEACPLFAQSQRLDPGGGTLLNLAVCHERIGRLATAYAEYNEALSLAIAAGRADRQKTASDAINALAPRLPRLVLSAAALPEAATITLDGQPVSRSVWSIPTPVDPGPHTLLARAPGHEPHQAAFTAREGETAELVLPALKPDAPAPQPSAATSAAPSATPPPAHDFGPGGLQGWPPVGAASAPERRCVDPSEPGCGPRRRLLERSEAPPLKMALLVVAITAGVASATTGLGALIEHRLASCTPAEKRCDSQADLDRAHTARALAWVSTLSLGVTAATAAGYWMIPDRKVQVDFSASPSGLSIALGGRLP